MKELTNEVRIRLMNEYHLGNIIAKLNKQYGFFVIEIVNDLTHITCSKFTLDETKNYVTIKYF